MSAAETLSSGGAVLDVVEPPDEFTHKMGLIKTCLSLSGQSMFTPTVKSFANYPCSLVFEEVAAIGVSPAAIQIMDALSEKLGPLGTIQGFYGAGGGSMHLFYFGKFNDGEGFPTLLDLLQKVVKVDDRMLPPFSWVSAVDATHQKLFPRTFAEIAGGKYDFLKVFYDIINSSEVKIFPFALPPVTIQEFPFLEEPRVLFVEPHFQMMHDGGCPDKCPRDDSVLVEAVGGAPGNPGDLYESPSFAFIYLESGEIMALCNWDYRD